MPVDHHDRVARAQPDRSRRRVRLDLPDRDVRVPGRADHVRHQWNGDREQDVGARAGEDDGDPLPGRLSPVRVVGEAVAQLRQAPARCTLGRRRQLSSGDGLLELGQMLARGRQVVRLQRTLDPGRFGKEARVLLEGRAELHVHVGRCGAVHAGDLHVAAQRDRSDPVLDPLTAHLHERRRKAEVEASRIHAHRARDEEVSRLVQEDQESEPEDGNRDAHGPHRRA